MSYLGDKIREWTGWESVMKKKQKRHRTTSRIKTETGISGENGQTIRDAQKPKLK